MKSSYRHRIAVFLILFFVGVFFGAGGMVLPPLGIIDSSVLVLIAQIFVLAASVYGFEIHFDIKEGKFDSGLKDKKEDGHVQV